MKKFNKTKSIKMYKITLLALAIYTFLIIIYNVNIQALYSDVNEDLRTDRNKDELQLFDNIDQNSKIDRQPHKRHSYNNNNKISKCWIKFFIGYLFIWWTERW